MNSSGDTPKNSPKALACVLLMPRLPLSTSDVTLLEPNTLHKSRGFTWRASINSSKMPRGVDAFSSKRPSSNFSISVKSSSSKAFSSGVKCSSPFDIKRLTSASRRSYSCSVSIALGKVRASNRPYLRSFNSFLATAVIFPSPLIVLLMSQYESEQHFLLPVKNLRDQPVGIPPDIEHGARADQVRVGIIDPDLRQVRPVGLFRPAIPVVKRLCGIRVLRTKSSRAFRLITLTLPCSHIANHLPRTFLLIGAVQAATNERALRHVGSHIAAMWFHRSSTTQRVKPLHIQARALHAHNPKARSATRGVQQEGAQND